MDDLRQDIIDSKDWDSRRFDQLVNNFYLMRSALRYFSVKKGISFTSSKVSESFPLPVTVAGSCLKVLEDLDVVESRSSSNSPDRYLPETVDLDKMKDIEKILVENSELNEFYN